MNLSSARADDGSLMAPPSPTPSGPIHVGGLNGIQEESECSEIPTHGGSDRLGTVRDLSPSGGVRVVSDLLGPSPPPPPPTLLNGHSAMNGKQGLLLPIFGMSIRIVKYEFNEPISPSRCDNVNKALGAV